MAFNTITIGDFAKVEIQVGKVVEAKNKEGSEKLIRLVRISLRINQELYLPVLEGLGIHLMIF